MEKIALTELGDLAKRVLANISPKNSGATIIALSGDLGAGKTTFVQTLGKELGIQEPMQSPTYVLMKSYPIVYKQFTRLIHIDAYRLEHPEQFTALRPDEFLKDPKNIICVEWPERIEGMLPKPDLTLQFSSDGASEGERYIQFD